MINIKYFELLSSTNDYAKKNINILNHFDVITSKVQTHGRGRSNHLWMSDGDNLYLSIVLKNVVNHNELFKLIMKASLSVVKTLSDYNINSTIKYPNDILVDRKKISGILIESSSSEMIDYVVVGVGLNINQTDFKELNSKAISMASLKQTEFNTNDVLLKYLEIYKSYDTLTDNQLLKEYKNNSLLLNKNIEYENSEYKIINITITGNLVLEGKEIIIEKNFNEISLENIY